MSDYGYDTRNGWFFKGAWTHHKDTLIKYVGNPTPPRSEDIEDRYMARDARLGARNNPYTELHLFVNRDETICPPIHDSLFRDSTLAHKTNSTEFSNIYIHLGARGVFQDFNKNNINEPFELQYWGHHQISMDEEKAAESWFMNRFLNGKIPQPVIKDKDTVFVIGYIKTEKYSLWMGDGQNCAGNLDYSFTPSEKTFSLHVSTHNKAILSKLTVDCEDWNGNPYEVELNSKTLKNIPSGKTFAYNSLKDRDRIKILNHAPRTNTQKTKNTRTTCRPLRTASRAIAHPRRSTNSITDTDGTDRQFLFPGAGGPVLGRPFGSIQEEKY